MGQQAAAGQRLHPYGGADGVPPAVKGTGCHHQHQSSHGREGFRAGQEGDSGRQAAAIMELIKSRQQGLFLFDHVQQGLSFCFVQRGSPQVPGNPDGTPGGSLGADLACGNLSDALGRGGSGRGVIAQGQGPASAVFIHVCFRVRLYAVSIAFVNDQQSFNGTGHEQTLPLSGAAEADGNAGFFPDHIRQAGRDITVVQITDSDPQGSAVLSGRGARGQRADSQQQEQGQEGPACGDPAFEACQAGKPAGKAPQMIRIRRRRRENRSRSAGTGLPVGQGNCLLFVAADPAGGRYIKDGQEQTYQTCSQDRQQIGQYGGQAAARRDFFQSQQHIPGQGQSAGQVERRGQKAAGPQSSSQDQAYQKQDVADFSGTFCRSGQ